MVNRITCSEQCGTCTRQFRARPTTQAEWLALQPHLDWFDHVLPATVQPSFATSKTGIAGGERRGGEGHHRRGGGHRGVEPPGSAGADGGTPRPAPPAHAARSHACRARSGSAPGIRYPPRKLGRRAQAVYPRKIRLLSRSCGARVRRTVSAEVSTGGVVESPPAGRLQQIDAWLGVRAGVADLAVQVRAESGETAARPGSQRTSPRPLSAPSSASSDQ